MGASNGVYGGLERSTWGPRTGSPALSASSRAGPGALLGRAQPVWAPTGPKPAGVRPPGGIGPLLAWGFSVPRARWSAYTESGGRYGRDQSRPERRDERVRPQGQSGGGDGRRWWDRPRHGTGARVGGRAGGRGRAQRGEVAGRGQGPRGPRDARLRRGRRRGRRGGGRPHGRGSRTALRSTRHPRQQRGHQYPQTGPRTGARRVEP